MPMRETTSFSPEHPPSFDMPRATQQDALNSASKCFRAAIAYFKNRGQSVETISSDIIELILAGFVSAIPAYPCKVPLVTSCEAIICSRVAILLR
jgi:hypothetical protein